MKARTASLDAPVPLVLTSPAAATVVPPAGRTVTPWLMVVLAVILFSGGLFGYDQGVISGALHGIKATFSLSALLVEVVTSWVTLGALFGALAGGELADRIGRKRTVLIAGAMFTLGALVAGAGIRYDGAGGGPADRRGRGRCGGGGSAALCRRTGANQPARSFRVLLPVGHHRRDLPGLSG